MSEQEIKETGPLARARVGEELGVSDWISITQEMITEFGSATLDADPMHDDPAWAAEKSPFGKTIAYGFQTIGLLTHLMRGALGGEPYATEPSEKGYALNYGFDRLRLVSPVPVGSNVRGRFRLSDRSVDEKGRIVQRVNAVVEIEHHAAPALVADWLFIWVPAEAA
ncbi:MAG: MaoC/PaaZ C-terminal domain-containing protein [Hyphomonas sp.]